MHEGVIPPSCHPSVHCSYGVQWLIGWAVICNRVYYTNPCCTTSSFLNMSPMSAPLMLPPPSTLIKRPLAPYISQICGMPATPHPTPQRLKRPKRKLHELTHECNQTGDNHRDNKLSLSQLVPLSSQIAQILQQIPSDYYYAWRPYSSHVADAARLLQRDTVKYRARISGGSPYCADTNYVKRNAILRALILFHLGGIHAAQYLEHDSNSRVAWIIQLNTSAAWIKSDWERDMSARMIRVIKRKGNEIRKTCNPHAVYSVVFNAYFLMLCSRRHCENLRTEMDRMGVQEFSWHGISILRKAFFKSQISKERCTDIWVCVAWDRQLELSCSVAVRACIWVAIFPYFVYYCEKIGLSEICPFYDVRLLVARQQRWTFTITAVNLPATSIDIAVARSKTPSPQHQQPPTS